MRLCGLWDTKKDLGILDGFITLWTCEINQTGEKKKWKKSSQQKGKSVDFSGFWF